MMLTHLALTGDGEQYALWKERVERVRQVDAIDRAADPETKSLLASGAAWRQMREAGLIGVIVCMSVSSLWMSWLFTTYAAFHGLSWLATSLFLLPLPIAWFVGRHMWERAALQGMKDNVGKPTLRKRVRGFFRGIGRSFGAGFGFGFTLVFLQALITWFFTPAPTFALELFFDFADATVWGTISGFMGMMLGPIVSRPAPEPKAGLPPALLPAPEDS